MLTDLFKVFNSIEGKLLIAKLDAYGEGKCFLEFYTLLSQSKKPERQRFQSSDYINCTSSFDFSPTSI